MSDRFNRLSHKTYTSVPAEAVSFDFNTNNVSDHVQSAIEDDGNSSRVDLLALDGKEILRHSDVAPIPEIHWSIDRMDDAYSRRLGFDVLAWLDNLSDPDREQILLELGPGNGAFKNEVDERITGYKTFGVCDKLYYPLTTLIGKIVDFEKLEKATGEVLSGTERELFCNFLYKILVIKEGQSHLDQFEYDQDVQIDLASNINQLPSWLESKAPLLTEVTCIPDHISGRDNEGNVCYPYKIQRPEKESFQKIYRAFSAYPNTYFRTELGDLYQALDIYPDNIFFAHFSDLNRLKDEQVDVMIGARSSVYVQGEAYIQFMTEMTKKLQDNGIHVDDSIRDNDGWCYRLAELQKVQEASGIPIYVVLGPPLEREDFCQDDIVPLSAVISKDPQKREVLRSSLCENSQLIPLDEIIADKGYLKKLDRTGKVINSLHD